MYSKTCMKKNRYLMLPFIVFAIIFLIIATFSHKQTKKHTNIPSEKSKQDIIKELTPLPTAPINEMQNNQLEIGKSIKTKRKTFNITAGNYYLTPKTITVNQGDTVMIVFSNIAGYHNFAIDHLHVKITDIRAGQLRPFTFRADKKGTYQFYSDSAQDKAMGMKGTLIVQ
jgi:plastocyanin